MSANSSIRRAVKRLARQGLGDRGYSWLQAIVMARDIRSGSWTEPELDLVPLVVQPGDHAVDVGANYGVWTWHLGRAAGHGHVHAFEPVPFTASTLRKVLRLLRVHNATVHAVACADEAGEMTLVIPVQDNGAISAGQAHTSVRDDERPERERHVRWAGSTQVVAPVVRLDDVLGSAGPVSLLKCDVEGAEALVLRGAEHLLDRDLPVLVLEINPWFLDGMGQSLDELLDPLTMRGYVLYRYVDGRLREVLKADVVEDNYVLVHPSRLDRLGSLLPCPLKLR